MDPEAPPASSADPSPQPPAGSGRLPAPYRDPLAALGQDLRAVLASLRLRLRELWRRNRQGDLSVPGFWPRGLTSLFWPLLLALLLAVLILLPLGLFRWLPAPAPPVPEQPETLRTTPLPEARPTGASTVLPPAEPLAAGPPEPAPPAVTEPAPLQLDPLLELLSQDDPRHLILSAHPEPASGRLELRLSEPFSALPEPDRQREAARWLERSRTLGYERLELLDDSGRQLGRQARVGSGMILLAPESAR